MSAAGLTLSHRALLTARARQAREREREAAGASSRAGGRPYTSGTGTTTGTGSSGGASGGASGGGSGSGSGSLFAGPGVGGGATAVPSRKYAVLSQFELPHDPSLAAQARALGVA